MANTQCTFNERFERFIEQEYKKETVFFIKDMKHAFLFGAIFAINKNNELTGNGVASCIKKELLSIIETEFK